MHSNADKFSSFFSKTNKTQKIDEENLQVYEHYLNSMCSVNLEKKMSKKHFNVRLYRWLSARAPD